MSETTARWVFGRRIFILLSFYKISKCCLYNMLKYILGTHAATSTDLLKIEYIMKKHTLFPALAIAVAMLLLLSSPGFSQGGPVKVDKLTTRYAILDVFMGNDVFALESKNTRNMTYLVYRYNQPNKLDFWGWSDPHISLSMDTIDIPRLYDKLVVVNEKDGIVSNWITFKIWGHTHFSAGRPSDMVGRIKDYYYPRSKKGMIFCVDQTAKDKNKQVCFWMFNGDPEYYDKGGYSGGFRPVYLDKKLAPKFFNCVPEFSPDGKYALNTTNGTLADLKQGERTWTGEIKWADKLPWAANSSSDMRTAFSEDGAKVAVAYGTEMRVLSIATGELLNTISLTPEQVAAVDDDIQSASYIAYPCPDMQSFVLAPKADAEREMTTKGFNKVFLVRSPDNIVLFNSPTESGEEVIAADEQFDMDIVAADAKRESTYTPPTPEEEARRKVKERSAEFDRKYGEAKRLEADIEKELKSLLDDIEKHGRSIALIGQKDERILRKADELVDMFERLQDEFEGELTDNDAALLQEKLDTAKSLAATVF